MFPTQTELVLCLYSRLHQHVQNGRNNLYKTTITLATYTYSVFCNIFKNTGWTSVYLNNNTKSQVTESKSSKNCVITANIVVISVHVKNDKLG